MKIGILWDLDGTLLDTLEDLADGVNYALAQFGYPLRTLEEVRQFVGNGAKRLIDQAVPEDADPQPVFEVFRTYYSANCQIKTKPYEGIPEALAELGKKYPMAVVSNKPDMAVKPLCAQYFPGIFARGESEDCPRKPAPDMVYKAMAEIGVDSCIYVGDSEVDVLTAKNAGVPCLSVLWGFRDRQEIEAAGGVYFCETREELVRELEGIIHGK
jgi:phosphoglycolate phosphatase